MKDGKFEASDFCFHELGNLNQSVGVEACARMANALLPELKKQWLAELLKDAPKVYSDAKDLSEPDDGEWVEDRVANQSYPFQRVARLIEIREINEKRS